MIGTVFEKIEYTDCHTVGWEIYKVRSNHLPELVLPAIGGSESLTKLLEEALAAVKDDIDIIHKFSNTIRKASVESHNMRAVANFTYKDEDGNDLGQLFKDNFATPLLETKFPKAHKKVQTRLASTMSLRRRRILYRKSRYGAEPIRILPKHTAVENIKQPSKIVESTNFSKSKTGDWEHSRLQLARTQVLSRAHTATTLDSGKFRKASTPSRLSSAETILSMKDDDIPPKPTTAEGLEPMCPYCFLVLLGDDATNPKKWRYVVSLIPFII